MTDEEKTHWAIRAQLCEGGYARTIADGVQRGEPMRELIARVRITLVGDPRFQDFSVGDIGATLTSVYYDARRDLPE